MHSSPKGRQFFGTVTPVSRQKLVKSELQTAVNSEVVFYGKGSRSYITSHPVDVIMT
jgi:hypothetical protein